VKADTLLQWTSGEQPSSKDIWNHQLQICNSDDKF